MTTCYIIDDDSYAIAALTKYIDQLPWLSLIGSHTNPLLALAEIQDGPLPDIVFLDVEMPELSGLELADQLPEQTMVIITTAYRKYAFEAFEKQVMGFLLKPFSFRMFAQTLHKVKTWL